MLKGGEKMKRFQKGFTMIELLIVIAVLGVLAVAVLSAINPIEQINRGKDTGSRSDAEQLLGAVERFYTSSGYYPWLDTPNDTPTSQAWVCAVDGTAAGVAAPCNAAWASHGSVAPHQIVLTRLSAGGTSEIKASFVNRLSAVTTNHLFVYNRGTSGDSTYICFSPLSSSFNTEAGNRCTAGLPTDLMPMHDTICTATKSWICLP